MVSMFIKSRRVFSPKFRSNTRLVNPKRQHLERHVGDPTLFHIEICGGISIFYVISHQKIVKEPHSL